MTIDDSKHHFIVNFFIISLPDISGDRENPWLADLLRNVLCSNHLLEDSINKVGLVLGDAINRPRFSGMTRPV